jgi:hypothetical protein
MMVNRVITMTSGVKKALSGSYVSLKNKGITLDSNVMGLFYEENNKKSTVLQLIKLNSMYFYHGKIGSL